MNSFAKIRFQFSTTLEGELEDTSFTKERLKISFLSQIGIDDKLQDFISHRIGHSTVMPEENQQKSLQHNYNRSSWLQKLLASVSAKAETNSCTVKDNNSNFVGLQSMLISESDQRKSVQRYSAYSIWLKKLLGRPKSRLSESNVRPEMNDESDTKWIDPIDVIAHKTMKQVNAVSKATKSLKSFNAAINLYKSFVRPMVELSLPVTSPYKMTDLAHNSVHAQSEIIKHISGNEMNFMPGESTDDVCKVATEFVLLYKMINGFANMPVIMNKINTMPALRPLVFHNHLFSHSLRGTKYPEEGLALFILLKVTPHQFNSFQKYCCLADPPNLWE